MAKRTVKQILTAARDLIADRKRWCQYYRGKDENGEYVEGWQKAAKQRCALGAIDAVLKKDCGGSPAYFALKSAIDGDIATFNNRSTHRQVIAKFNEAIKAA